MAEKLWKLSTGHFLNKDHNITWVEPARTHPWDKCFIICPFLTLRKRKEQIEILEGSFEYLTLGISRRDQGNVNDETCYDITIQALCVMLRYKYKKSRFRSQCHNRHFAIWHDCQLQNMLLLLNLFKYLPTRKTCRTSRVYL